MVFHGRIQDFSVGGVENIREAPNGTLEAESPQALVFYCILITKSDVKLLDKVSLVHRSSVF